MVFDNEKRIAIKIKAKPGIMDLAKQLYKVSYPFSSSLNIDDMFEEMVVRYAVAKGLMEDPLAPRPNYDFTNFNMGGNSLESEINGKLETTEDLYV